MAATFRNTIRSFSPRPYWREILAVLMLLLAIIFFRSERKELNDIVPHILQAKTVWVVIGCALTVCYILLMGGMYKKSFAAIRLSFPLLDAAALFLKRNFISVFLPAGGVSALAYSPSEIRRSAFNKTQVHQASGLFGFAGLLTVFIAGLPVMIYTIYHNSQFENSWIGLVAVLLVILVLMAVVRNITRKGKIYQWLDKKFPSITPALNELFAANVNTGKFAGAVGFSMGVELCGMLHVYIAMLALGLPASFGVSATAYIVSVLLMVVSPFLRGLGAVELSMVYVLEQSGYSSSQALSITILYRVFEFWLPLVLGLFAFGWKGRKLFLRLAPAMLTFTLGIVNIISVVTPPIHERLRLIREYIPLNAIHASNLLVLFIGVTLLVTTAFLFRGLRNAWLIALILSLVSLAGHLTKALDYEEAIIAAITMIVLIATVGQYRRRSSMKWMQAGLKTSVISFVAVLLFGFMSFYFIDPKHFGMDFTWKQSLEHTFRSYLLVEDTSLNPQTRFGHELLWLIRSLGFLTWGFLLLTLIQPRLVKPVTKENYRERAKFLLTQFGNSSVDYFKLYKDKLYFFSDVYDAFVAYRIAGGFAIVLEEPVCAEEYKADVIAEFDKHCRKMGLKLAFYRVDENGMQWVNELRKNKLKIGQEAILEVTGFTLEGKDKKSLRNGLNSLARNGFTVVMHFAPQDAGLIRQLKNVSDEWLEGFDKEEYIFSQGMFDEKELQQQDIITVEDALKNIKAFLNIIPDYAEDECTYDLIRRTKDAPAAAMDALIIKFIGYAKENKKLYLNLGLVPMTGIINPDNTAEQIIKLAAAKIKRFQHYQGLREFKEKYATLWENKYLVYDDDLDLLHLPLALNNVMKP
ncbi:MAG: lysylphosphatidylglycerol synthetase family protein [Chitinophagaceae bacterium]|nr:lysylphosphatidylglycerol synthetase family protein [Chitinophagaceae bacterium]